MGLSGFLSAKVMTDFNAFSPNYALNAEKKLQPFIGEIEL